MVKLDVLAPNLITILSEVMKVQDIAKYLTYNVDTPLMQPDVDSSSLMFKVLYPFPFDMEANYEDCTQLRVYYPQGIFTENQQFAETSIYFDIIVARSLWLVSNGEISSIRPYEIMRLIVNQFDKKSIDTLGRIEFLRFDHLNVNEKYDCIRIQAEMVSMGR